MKYFKPAPDVKWILEVAGPREWDPDRGSLRYIWERLDSASWQVKYHQDERGVWAQCEGMISEDPSSYDYSAEFSVLRNDELFWIIL